MPQQHLSGELDTDELLLAVSCTDQGWKVSMVAHAPHFKSRSFSDAGAILDTDALDVTEAVQEWVTHVVQAWLYGTGAQAKLASEMSRNRLRKVSLRTA